MTFERRRLRVYVAGPISSDIFEGVTRAIRVGKQMVADGLAPYIPHLDAFMFMHHEDGAWNSFLEWDLEWSTLAEAVYRLEGASRGADLEVKMAEELGTPVFHESPTVVRDRRTTSGYRTEGGYATLLKYATEQGLRGVRVYE